MQCHNDPHFAFLHSHQTESGTNGQGRMGALHELLPFLEIWQLVPPKEIKVCIIFIVLKWWFIYRSKPSCWSFPSTQQLIEREMARGARVLLGGKHWEMWRCSDLYIQTLTQKSISPRKKKKAAEEKLRGQEVVKKEHYFSLGSRPSLVYCQQMSPIRSCTLALAMVTTVMGCSLSWLVCSGR